MFENIFPPLDTALDMDAEELAPFVLKHLKTINKINRYNYTLVTNGDLRSYAGDNVVEFQKRLMEAFIWLEREMFLAPIPDEQGDWRYITKRGEKLLESENFKAYTKGSLLPSEGLHPVLVRIVKPLYIRGDYDTAIFQAFKAVEVLVREKGKYKKEDIGVALMRKAFRPMDGKLSNKYSQKAEQQAMSDLFAGAIGLFKNPASHRNMESITPADAASYIQIANSLLKIIDSEG